jgi:hypothetical protein
MPETAVLLSGLMQQQQQEAKAGIGGGRAVPGKVVALFQRITGYGGGGT